LPKPEEEATIDISVSQEERDRNNVDLRIVDETLPDWLQSNTG